MTVEEFLGDDVEASEVSSSVLDNELRGVYARQIWTSYNLKIVTVDPTGRTVADLICLPLEATLQRAIVLGLDAGTVVE